MNRRVWAIGVVAVALVVGLLWAVKPSHKPPPNVLILLWDTARADRMSLYGYDKPTTPKMAEWAERGLVFERAWASGVWTVPSHGSLFTGLPVRTHGAHIRYRWLDRRYAYIGTGEGIPRKESH